MLEGLDEVGWTELSHAYGSANDVPAMLRQAASGGHAAKEALEDLYGIVFHQGTVYTATVATVPFLIELARWAPTYRDQFAWMLGELADPGHAYGKAFDAVKVAVAAYADVFTGLLGDADAQVRAAAAYALAQCSLLVTPLWDRWAVEDDPDVRASLVLALGLRDPARSAAALADAVMDAAPVVRVAGALALARNRVTWPDGAIRLVVSAIDDGADIAYAWWYEGGWIDDLVLAADDSLAVALLHQMLSADSAGTREMGAYGIAVRNHARRSAPTQLTPMLRPLLDDPDRTVRGYAFYALRQSGAASRQFIDEIADIAARLPQITSQSGFTAELLAVETLMLLGDERWLDPVCEAFAEPDGIKSLPLHGDIPCSPAVLAAARRRLAQLCTLASAHPAIPKLVLVAGLWGPEAAAIAPELLAAPPYVGKDAARALLRVGHLAAVMEPYLREADDPEAAMGVWRLTVDPQPLVSTLDVLLTRGKRRAVDSAAHTITEVGSGLAPLVGVALTHLTGTAAPTHPDREIQILAARALWHLGIPPSELVGPLMTAINSPHGHRDAIRLLRDMHAPEAIPHLEQFAERDERIHAASDDNNAVWADETLRENLRTTIAILRAL
jgi:hypothetical protein